MKEKGGERERYRQIERDTVKKEIYKKIFGRITQKKYLG